MRVLLVNPAFPRTFYSFDRVLKMLGRKAVHPPLGLLTVAALLPRSWDFELVDLTFQTLTEEDWAGADVVLVSGLNVQRRGIAELLREAKRRGKRAAVGGPAVFHGPQEALRDGANIVVIGELESCADRFIQALESKESGGIVTGDSKADLTRSPAPRLDLIDVNKYLTMGIQFSRGCPFQCEFCDVTHILGREVRTKTPAQIIKELDQLKSLGWNENVFFVDDNFIGSRKNAKVLLKELITWRRASGGRFRFNTQASVNMAEDPEILDLMVQADFYKVFLGIETDDRESLERNKKFQNARTDLDAACRKIIEAGLEIEAGWIIGFDNEKPDADRRVVDFAMRNHIPQVLVNLLEAPPGTDLWKRLEKEGREPRLPSEEISAPIGLINYKSFRPVKDLAWEVINIYESLYEPAAYYQRAFEEFALMKPRPAGPIRLPSVLQLRALFITLFRQGVLYPSRRVFWRYFFKGLAAFPDRFEFFLNILVLFEHHYEFRGIITGAIEQELRLAMSDSDEKAVP